MTRLLQLYRGEVMRMRRYGITLAGLAAALIWVLMIQFSGAAEADGINALFPILLVADASLMSLLLAGVTLTFEKQENTLKSMLITPIDSSDYLLAKTLGVVTSSLTSLVLLLVYAILFKGLEINLPGIFAAVMLVSFTFAQLGILLTYHSKDFTDLLQTIMKLMLLLAVPTVLELTQFVQGTWLTIIQYINPTKHAMVLLQAASLPIERRELGIALAYLLAFACLLYVVIRRQFSGYAAKGGI